MSEVLSRKKAIDELLQPITWSWSSSISSRQMLVDRRHKAVRAAMPLMTKTERERAKEWLEKERHEGLWD